MLLSDVLNWKNAIGFVLGLLAQSGVAHARAWWLDRYHPRPDGCKHVVGRLSRMWVATAIAAFIVAVVTTQQTQTAYELKRCNHEIVGSLRANLEVIGQDNNLSLQQRDLFKERAKLDTNYITQLVAAPPDVASRTINDPIRQLYQLDITLTYRAQAAGLDRQIEEISVKQNDLDRERRAHPLPEMTCGK